ncbi:hypothetical protein [Bradyrhizobium sp. SZCCHNS3052]|uniref:hypothetical protein n=1 Tax=Bradyrhizobium sp. SZCCHNS3052 TaxID=3057321 RepID=UPI00291693EC|nr:hypothetical protein [Bradyrhizobium sp. SZCCHNS3052]
MKSWVQPLPCEGTISAVLGASLGVILALDGGLGGHDWSYVPTQLSLLAYVVVFAVSLHFACTAVIKRSGSIFAFFLILCVANGVLFNISRLRDVNVNVDQRIVFLPDNVATSVTIVFLVWLLVQLILSTALFFSGKRK